MKSAHVSMGVGFDGVAFREHDVPRPGPGEVLLRIHAAALNYREIKIIKTGRYALPVKDDVVPLCDGAGEVVEVGPGASGVVLGDRVVASIFPHWIDGAFRFERSAQLGGSLDGMLTEYAVLPASSLVRIPGHLSWDEAASLPCASVTAWNALTGTTPPRPGDSVLVQGSGGVSLAALQLAKAFGARVVATTTSERKADRLRQLGADTVIDASQMLNWGQAVRAATSGNGVQIVVEIGAGLAGSYAAVAFGGNIALVANPDLPAPIDAAQAFSSGATLRPIAAGSREQLAAALRAMDAHRIRPVIARVFPMSELSQALQWYESGQAFGKVVLRVVP